MDRLLINSLAALQIIFGLGAQAMDTERPSCDHVYYDLFQVETLPASDVLKAIILEVVKVRLEELKQAQTYDVMPLGDQACQNMALVMVEELERQIKRVDAEGSSRIMGLLNTAEHMGTLLLSSSELAYLLSTDSPMNEKQQFPDINISKTYLKINKKEKKEIDEKFNKWKKQLRVWQNDIIARPFINDENFEIQKSKIKVFRKDIAIIAPRLIHLIDDFEEKLLDKNNLIVKFRIFEHLQFFTQGRHTIPGLEDRPYLTIYYQVKDRKLELISPPDENIPLLVIDAIASNTISRTVIERITEDLNGYKNVIFDPELAKCTLGEKGSPFDEIDFPWLERRITMITSKNINGKLIHEIANQRQSLNLVKLLKAATANHSPYSELIRKQLAPELMEPTQAEQNRRIPNVGVKYQSLFNTLHVYAQLSTHKEESLLNPQGLFKADQATEQFSSFPGMEKYSFNEKLLCGAKGENFYFRDDGVPKLFNQFSKNDDLQRAIEEAVYVWNNKFLESDLLPILLNPSVGSKFLDIKKYLTLVTNATQSAIVTAICVGNLDALKILKKFNFWGEDLFSFATREFVISKKILKSRGLDENEIKKEFPVLALTILGYFPGSKLEQFIYNPLVAAIMQSDIKIVSWLLDPQGGAQDPLEKIKYPWMGSTTPYAIAFGLINLELESILQDLHILVDDPSGNNSDAGVILRSSVKEIFQEVYNIADHNKYYNQGILDNPDTDENRHKIWETIYNFLGRKVSIHDKYMECRAKVKRPYPTDFHGTTLSLLIDRSTGSGIVREILPIDQDSVQAIVGSLQDN